MRVHRNERGDELTLGFDSGKEIVLTLSKGRLEVYVDENNPSLYEDGGRDYAEVSVPKDDTPDAIMAIQEFLGSL